MPKAPFFNNDAPAPDLVGELGRVAQAVKQMADSRQGSDCNIEKSRAVTGGLHETVVYIVAHPESVASASDTADSAPPEPAAPRTP